MHDYKIVVLGSGGVGKTALTLQFVQGVFVEKYDPTIEDSYRKPVEQDGTTYMVEIVDTAGTEQFPAMRDFYLKNGHGFILVYSITSHSSFTDIPDMWEQLLRVKDRPHVPTVLVGNKCDMKEHRVVFQDQGEELAKKYQKKHVSFFETSAKKKLNVIQVFHEVIKQVAALPPEKPKRKTKNQKCILV